ncbi:bifunctional YncE family protein/alkaline phosphatase family protein [Nannocystaceae bacterium ST9]
MRRSLVWIPSLLLPLAPACKGDSAGDDEIGETGSDTSTTGTTTGTTTGPATESEGESSETGEPQDCVAEPPPEATLRMGLNEDGTLLVAGGRKITPVGENLVVPGFPTDVAVHPLAEVAYVTSSARYVRKLLAIDLEFGTIMQDIDRDNAFYGLEVAPDGSRVYASGGGADVVEYYDADIDGMLTLAGEVAVGRYPAGLALSDDGTRLWAGQWRGTGAGANKASEVIEIDTATMTEIRAIAVPLWAWDVIWVPNRDELYVSTLDDVGLAVVDLQTGTTVEEIDVPISSAGLAVAPDGARVWAAIAGTDEVVAIDTATRAVIDSSFVGELLDEQGEVVHDSNVNALSYDPLDDRLYATRGSDNAVSVLDGATLDLLGAMPTGWYPTDVALTPDGTRLLVSEGKGSFLGPNMGQSITERMGGTMSTIELAGVDLPTTTAEVEANYERPGAVYPFTCDLPNFPIPSQPGQTSPIEHVILVVKENKTFDCVFGDLEGVDVERDPALVEWGELYTPNMHALALEFGLSDNFYSEGEVSDTGHMWLAGGHVTEYVERTWIESYSPGEDFTGYQLYEASGPGDYFVHLIDNDVDFRVYGEIVGTLSQSKLGNGTVLEHIDGGYPGGPVINYDTKDEDKAQYIANQIADGQLAAFSYVLLPNDHTVGTVVGKPTPESMVADNDYALGILVDAVSHSQFWATTAIFVVQDDPQGCTDSVDVHRTFTIVISPWARRHHVSHVNISFASVFATIDRILGIPAIGREDATAAPLWDFFTAVPDPTPYVAIPRNIPETFSDVHTPGAAASAKMDFGGPDRNPELEVLLLAYRAWQRGEISKAEAEARIAAPFERLGEQRWAELVAESKEEREEYDEAIEALHAWQAGEPPPVRDEDD